MLFQEIGRTSICLSAPYAEPAIMALASRASSKGLLNSIYMPSKAFARYAANASRVVGSNKIAKRLQKPSNSVPELREIAPLLEPLRMIMRLLHGGRLTDRYMYMYKRRFDRDVCANNLSDCTVVVGMPGACINMFLRWPDKKKIFHEVNGHPRAHNSALLSHFSEAQAKDELIPTQFVETIENELGLADLVVVPSNLVKDQMLDGGIKPTSILRIPYGVDLDAFNVGCVSESNRRPKFLFVGQVSLRKGVSFLIDAMRRVNADLRIIGPLVQASLIEGLPSNVIYDGPKSRSEVAASMAVADAFVLPTLEDACALVTAEAVASGLPVVSTPMNGACELLELTDVIQVSAGDTLDLVNALASVKILTAENRAERASRIRNRAQLRDARSTIRDWITFSDQFLSAIEDAPKH